MSLIAHRPPRLKPGQFTLAAMVTWVVLAAALFFFIRNRAVPLLILLSVMGISSVAIGSWGIVTKRPYLLPPRWRPIICLLSLSPMIAQMSNSIFRPRAAIAGMSYLDLLMDWLLPIVFLVLFGIYLVLMKDYVFVGVTRVTFREGLLAALKKLDLPHEERRSVFRLTSVGADLKLSAGFWSGYWTIMVTKKKCVPLLETIAKAMNDYYQISDVQADVVRCVLVIHGVTAASIREGLLAALKKLNLPYEQSASVMHLPTVGAYLKAWVGSWRGTGGIDVTQQEFDGPLWPTKFLAMVVARITSTQQHFASVLEDIAIEMKDYYRSSAVPWNLVSSAFYFLTGAIMIGFAIWILRLN